MNGWPLAAIVYTDIATDGTLAGPNVDATAAMCDATDVPIVASGGVGTLDHLRALRPLPIQGAIVGRALYDQNFTLDEAIEAFEGGGDDATRPKDVVRGPCVVRLDICY